MARYEPSSFNSAFDRKRGGKQSGLAGHPSLAAEIRKYVATSWKPELQRASLVLFTIDRQSTEFGDGVISPDCKSLEELGGRSEKSASLCGFALSLS